jgi:oligosaccharide repeat unit polymerase
MLANPAFVFTFVWSMALFLYTRYWSNIFLELSNFTYFYILGSIFVSIFSWLFFIVITHSSRINYKRIMYDFSIHEKNKIKIIIILWISGTLIELIYFRDLPILSLVGLGSINYQDFGIPSLHGFLNAIILSISMYMLYQYILNQKKCFLIYYILTIFVPILGMNRGMLTSLLIQSVFVVIVFNGMKFNSMLKFLFYIVIFVFIFGKLGEWRYSGNPDDLYAVFQISDNYPVFLPKSVIWVYMYITSSINNLEYTLYSFSDITFEPYNSLFGLIPSFIRVYLDLPYELKFVVSAFNVSSFMPNYLASYGIYGSLIFYFISSLISMYIYYRYTKKYELAYGFILVILLHSISLSIFSDFFAIQVYFFQIIIQIIIFQKKSYIQNRSSIV